MTHVWKDRLPWILFWGHLGALFFGLVGILVMLPNPELWQDDPNAVKVFTWSMDHAGATHIWLGFATMLAFGIVAIGAKRTLIFAVIACGLSLASELIGTGTGWPFGNYEYTGFLGTKVLDRVPYTIPMSWFYMGFASYLVGLVIVQRLKLRSQTLWSLLLGAWFLTVWDLVLDPAMAHESLRIQFWTWDETGPYFGMPIKNFIGWTVTGLIFMALSRWLWRDEPNLQRTSIWLPIATYAVNLGFAMVLSGGVDLWIPIVLAVVLGLLPALWAGGVRVPQGRVSSGRLHDA